MPPELLLSPPLPELEPEPESEPEPELESELEPELESEFELPEPDEPESGEPPSEPPELSVELVPETFRFLPVLKSVSYQPVPFNRKAAADTSFLRDAVSHAGQSVSGSSAIF